MKCKFMFRGKALEVRNRHFSGDVGKILAIDGTRYRVTKITNVRLDYQLLDLARVEPDPEELAVVARVLEQIRSSLFPPSLPEEYEGFCNLPQVQAEKKGRKEALDQVAAVLNRIEADYRAGD